MCKGTHLTPNITFKNQSNKLLIKFQRPGEDIERKGDFFEQGFYWSSLTPNYSACYWFRIFLTLSLPKELWAYSFAFILNRVLDWLGWTASMRCLNVGTSQFPLKHCTSLGHFTANKMIPHWRQGLWANSTSFLGISQVSSTIWRQGNI